MEEVLQLVFAGLRTRRVCLLVALGSVLTAAVLVGTAYQSHQDTLSAFESLARSARSEWPESLVWNPVGGIGQDQEFRKGLESPEHGVFSLKQLLSHSDPYVRGLSLIALAARGPRFLREIAALTRDEERFGPPSPEVPSTAVVPLLMNFPKDCPAWSESFGWFDALYGGSTVGDLAESIVQRFTNGFDELTLPDELEAFDDYWRTRQETGYCAGWLGEQYFRRRNEAGFAAHFRQRLERLPDPDSALIALHIYTVYEQASLDHEWLRSLCVRAGPDRLMEFLQRRPTTRDEDIRRIARRPGEDFLRIAEFILKNAGQLLRPQDAAVLLEIEEDERTTRRSVPWSDDLILPNQTSWWAIGAAQLRPEFATPRLRAALSRLKGPDHRPHRTALAIAIIEWLPRAQWQDAVDWFFDDPDHWECAWYRSEFLWHVAQLPGGREACARIARDRRFASLTWVSLKRLISTINRWASPPVVPERELEELTHPLGERAFLRDTDAARSEHPGATQEVEEALERWRRSVLSRLPDWASDHRLGKDVGS